MTIRITGTYSLKRVINLFGWKIAVGTSRGVVGQVFRNVIHEPQEFKIVGPLKLAIAVTNDGTLLSVMLGEFVINQWSGRAAAFPVFYHHGNDKVDLLVEVEVVEAAAG